MSPTEENVSSQSSLRLAISILSSKMSCLTFSFSRPSYLCGFLTFDLNIETFKDLKTLIFFSIFVSLQPRGRDENGNSTGKCLSRTE